MWRGFVDRGGVLMFVVGSDDLLGSRALSRLRTRCPGRCTSNAGGLTIKGELLSEGRTPQQISSERYRGDMSAKIPIE
jgi:hypothetical protein